jgi:hypothetical protein
MLEIFAYIGALAVAYMIIRVVWYYIAKWIGLSDDYNDDYYT